MGGGIGVEGLLMRAFCYMTVVNNVTPEMIMESRLGEAGAGCSGVCCKNARARYNTIMLSCCLFCCCLYTYV